MPAEKVLALIESGKAIVFAAFAADICCVFGVSAVKAIDSPDSLIIRKIHNW
jgi:hypothetical protein